MLLPLTGPRAALGASMRQAASLAQPTALDLEILDTGGDPVQAARVATRAVAGGAGTILGPLTTGETIAVLDEIDGAVPVVTFSNNQALAGGGAFVFGITPEQSVETMFDHAVGRGLRDIAVVVAPGALGEASLAAAADIAGRTGVDLVESVTHEPGRAGLAGRVFAGTRQVDAVLIAAGGEALRSFARDIRAASDVPLLGTVQWSRGSLADEPALRGGAFAAPDPASLAGFAARYEAANGATPGVVAALAHDAVAMAAAGGTTPATILRRSGYAGAVGDFRFRSDRTMIRDLAVLTVGADGAA